MPYVSPSDPVSGTPIAEVWGDAVKAALDYFATLIDDSAPSAFTPQIDQGASVNIAKTVNYSKYKVAGKRVSWDARITLTAAGTAGSGITVTLPQIIESSGTGRPIGYGVVTDVSSTIRYSCLLFNSSGKINFVWSEDQTGTNAWGADPNIALANGDVLDIFCGYFI